MTKRFSQAVLQAVLKSDRRRVAGGPDCPAALAGRSIQRRNYLMAAQRGWSIEETANKLLEVSAKTQERVRLRDEGNALITAQNAAAAEQNRHRLAA
jgi:hypothetical protein